MKPLDQLLKQYAEVTANAVEPQYEKTRADLHARIKPRGNRVGPILGVAALLTVLSLLVFQSNRTVVQVTSTPSLETSSTQPTFEFTAPAEQAPVKATQPAGPGRSEPVAFRVEKNVAAVDKLIDDQVALAGVSEQRGDLAAAAQTYFNLARTLNLHDRKDKVQWSLDAAERLARSANETRLLQEIASFRNSIGR